MAMVTEGGLERERRLVRAQIRRDQYLAGRQAQDRGRARQLDAQLQRQDRDLLIRGDELPEDRPAHLVEPIRRQVQVLDHLRREPQIHYATPATARPPAGVRVLAAASRPERTQSGKPAPR